MLIDIEKELKRQQDKGIKPSFKEKVWLWEARCPACGACQDFAFYTKNAPHNLNAVATCACGSIMEWKIGRKALINMTRRRYKAEAIDKE